MRLVFLFALLILFGCGKTPVSKFVCSCEESKSASEWLKTSIAPANNMSDEEMEDVVAELRKTAIMLHCHQRIFLTDHNGSIIWGIKENSLDTCETVHF